MIQKKKQSHLYRPITLAFAYIDETVIPETGPLVVGWINVFIHTKQKSLQVL